MIYEVTAKNKAGETYKLAPIITKEPGIDHVIEAVEDSAEYTKGDLIVGARVINDGEFPDLDTDSIGRFITIRFLAEAGASVLDHRGELPLYKLYRAVELCRMIKERVGDTETLLWGIIEEMELAGDGAKTGYR